MIRALLAICLCLLAFRAEAGSSWTGDRTLRLAVNNSQVLRLPEAASDVLVGDPAIAEANLRTNSLVYLFAHKAGQTNIFFFNKAGKQILNLSVEITQDVSALKGLLSRSLPDAKIQVDTMGPAVVLSGRVANADVAALAVEIATRVVPDGANNVVSHLTIAEKQQVMLKVRVVEMQRSVLKQLGVNNVESLALGKFTLPINSLNGFSNNYATTLGNIGLKYTSGANSASLTINAMEKQGLLRTLAEPTLTAISGEKADFLAGGEFPLPVNEKDNTITVSYKPFGVALGFVPVVLDEGRISLKINTEVSEITTEGAVQMATISLPGIKVRRASTAVELPSGGSMVLAGLISDNQKQEIKGLDGLMHLPILGALFRSRDYLANQTELVVIVTPYVVGPVAPSELATPIDGFSQPSDMQSLFLGSLGSAYGAGQTQNANRWRGPLGFIVE